MFLQALAKSCAGGCCTLDSRALPCISADLYCQEPTSWYSFPPCRTEQTEAFGGHLPSSRRPHPQRPVAATTTTALRSSQNPRPAFSTGLQACGAEQASLKSVNFLGERFACRELSRVVGWTAFARLLDSILSLNHPRLRFVPHSS